MFNRLIEGHQPHWSFTNRKSGCFNVSKIKNQKNDIDLFTYTMQIYLQLKLFLMKLMYNYYDCILYYLVV